MSPLCWRGCPAITRREVWLPLPIPTFHQHGHTYSISSLGKVRNNNTGRVLATRAHKTGYLVCSIGYKPGTTYVHKLVALAFLGPPPRDGQAWEVDHLDFDRLRPHVDNLRWLPKNVNAWRWKFWTDEPEDTGEDWTPQDQAAFEAAAAANGWPAPHPLRPVEMHRHPA